MADTLGGLVDKLVTVDMKMWNNQEFLYEVRRMSFDEFRNRFGSSDGLRDLYESVKKCCDLNVQRSALIDELDEKVLEIVRDAVAGRDLDDGRHVQRKHKTY